MQKRDAIDRKLITLLQDDARISTSEIARRIGLARSTVNERIARLEKNGTILGYSAIVRQEEHISETKSFVRCQCDSTKRGRVIEALNDFPEISECFTTSGEYDLMCMVTTPCAEDVDALIEELAAIPGIQALDTTLVLAKKIRRSPIARPRAPAQLSIAS